MTKKGSKSLYISTLKVVFNEFDQTIKSGVVCEKKSTHVSYKDELWWFNISD